MKLFLQLISALIVLALIGATLLAFSQRDIVSAAIALWPDLWFRATMLDLYCGFILFYLWVFSRERTLSKRLIWFVLIMGLGNIATGIYLLLQLRHWGVEQGAGGLLVRRER